MVGLNKIKLQNRTNTSSVSIEDAAGRDIAIIGMAARLPRAADIEDFWSNIRHGVECTGSFPKGRRLDVENYLRYKGVDADKIKYLQGAYLEEIDKFDHRFFHLSPGEACLMNPVQRLFTEIAWEAIEDGGYGGKRLAGSRTGVYLGFISDLEGYKYRSIIQELDPSLLSMSAGGNLSAVIPSRISYLLDLKGPSMLVDTACSSSLVALHLACQAIRNGDCEMAVVGGARLTLLPFDVKDEKIGIESSDGRTRTFDESADGSGQGEGVAAVLLKPLHRALRDGDVCYAVIKATAVNQDGSSMGITAPNPQAQAEVILRAWENAGIHAGTVSYVEAHGTGTPLGDTMEIEGLKGVFERFTDRKQFCAVGSLKTNLGHLYDCAGIASLLKAVLALRHKELPPSVNFHVPNRRIDFSDSPVYVNTRLRGWEKGEAPRRCGVSSFGLSGTNCHVVLEEAPEAVVKDSGSSSGKLRILALSANSREGLESLVGRYGEFASRAEKPDIGDICHTACTGRGHYRHRLAVLVRDADDFREKIAVLKALDWQSRPEGEEAWFYYNSHGVVSDEQDVREPGELTEAERNEISRAAADKTEEYAASGSKEEILRELCALYVMGADLRWDRLYEGEDVKKVSLPTYPFERSRCWIDIPAAKDAEHFEKERLFYTIKWRKEGPAVGEHVSRKGSVLVFRDAQGFGEEICRALRDEGRTVLEVEPGQRTERINDFRWIIRGEEEDYISLMKEAGMKEVSQVLHLWTMDPAREIEDLEGLEESQRRGVYSLFYFVRALMKSGAAQNMDLMLVSNYVNEATAEQERVIPENATLFGLGKAVNVECPGIRCRCLDLDGLADSGCILSELRMDGRPYLTAYRAGERYVEEFTEVDIRRVEDRRVEIRDEGVYIITGGLGKIGLSVARHLASKNRVRLALISRSGIPEGGALKSIQDIEASGAEVVCRSADVSSLEDVRRITDELREKYGRINGVIHSAGVTGNGFIVNRERRAFDKVLLPKVHGAWIMDHVTREDDLDFFVLFSSGVSMIGEAGLGDYTAANAYLDSFAACRKLRGKRTLAIDWVVWENARMAEGFSVNMDGIFKALPEAQGIYAFDRVLNKDLTRVLAGELNTGSVIGELLDKFPFRVSDSIKALFRKGGKQSIFNKRRTVELKGEVALKGREGEGYSEVEKKLAQVYRSVLGFNEINVYDNFFELGGNSILLTRMHGEVERLFPGRVRIADLFAFPSVAALARFIAGEGGERPQAGKDTDDTDREPSGKSGDIAVIGISVRLPYARSLNEFWRNIRDREDLIGRFPENRRKDADRYLAFSDFFADAKKKGIRYVEGAYLEEIDKFDCGFFRLSPREAEFMDPFQRIFLETAFEAIEDAGYGGKSLEGTSTGVYLGFAGNILDSYQKIIYEVEPASTPGSIAANLPAIIPGRISYLLNLNGPSMVVDTACSSSLVAVHLACQAIRAGDCSQAIAGGIKLHLLPMDDMCFKTGVEASDGRCRTFDDTSDGAGIGEGAAAVLLKPLDRAVRDNDNIYAVIRGSAINQDGTTMGITVPNPAAQTGVIVKAWKNAGVDPETISYIEAHGTATRLGDPIEIKGLKDAFERFTQKKQFCAISSVKSNIGHLYECAGVVNLVKSILALRNREIPSGIYFNRPNREIDFTGSPVFPNITPRKWETDGQPRRCGVNAFGLSGTNCHVVLEEYPEADRTAEPGSGGSVWDGEWHVLTMSARSEYSIKALIERYAGYVNSQPDFRPGDLCYTANTGRGHYNYRAAVIFRDAEDLKEKLGSTSYSEHRITEDERRELSAAARAKAEELASSGENLLEILEGICALYINGAEIDWKGLYRGRAFRRISLPVYPFEPKRCWISIPEVKTEGVSKNLYYSTAWRQEELKPGATGAIKGPVLILKDKKGIGEEAARRLRGEGAAVIEVEAGSGFERLGEGRYTVGTAQEDYCRLWECISGEGVSKVIHMMTLDSIEEAESLEALQESQKTGVYSLFYLVRAILERDRETALEMLLISSYVNEVTGEEERINPENATLFGLSKTIARECPQLSFRSVDLDCCAGADAVLSELAAAGSGSISAYRGGKRYVEEFREVDIASIGEKSVDIRDEGVYVITGGLGGLGLEMAAFLASHGSVNIALLSRSAIPGRESWDGLLEKPGDVRLCKRLRALKGLEAAGARVECCSVDMSDPGEAAGALDELRSRYKRINGVIHCAGVGGDRLVIDRKESDFTGVLLPKVDGAWILDRATRQDDLDFFIMFSSIATIFTAPGQGDYTAANAYLDSYSAYRSKKGKRTLTINWSTWKETGMAFDFNVNFDTAFKAMPTAAAIEGFRTVLNKDIKRVLIGEINYDDAGVNLLERSAVSLSADIRRRMDEARRRAGARTGLLHPRPERVIEHVSLTGRDGDVYSEMEKRIAGVWGQELGYDEINILDSFYELGGDSINGLKITNGINRELGKVVEPVDLFRHQTIEKLARFIEESRGTYNGIKPAEKKEYYPLSSAQKRLFALEQLKGIGTAYNLPWAALVEGGLDEGRVEEVMNVLCKRHDSFRTSFEFGDDGPVQRVHPCVDFRVVCSEADINAESGAEPELAGLIREFARPFALDEAPLLRVEIVRLAGGKNLLLVDMHHIISDGISMSILIREFAALYNGKSLPEMKLQYKDFACWQDGSLRSDFIRKQEAYWLGRFQGDIPSLDMPEDYPRPAIRSFEGDSVSFEIGGGLLKGLKDLASRAGATVYMVLLAVFNVLLYKYTGQEDIIVGSPVTGRTHPDLDGIIGMFVNTLAMRNHPVGGISFGEFLETVKESSLEAYENQDYQFEELVSRLGLKRDLSRNPLFDAMFSMLVVNQKAVEIEGLKLTPIEAGGGVCRFDLALSAGEGDEKIVFTLDYCTRLYRRETAERLAAHFVNILRQVAAEPGIRLSEIDMRSDEEKARKIPLPPKGRQEGKALSRLERTGGADRQYEAPSTETEIRLVKIFQRILGVNDIGVNDDFFMLGGHSLNAVALVLAIDRELDAEVPVGEVFTSPTVRQLAEYIERF